LEFENLEMQSRVLGQTR